MTLTQRIDVDILEPINDDSMSCLRKHYFCDSIVLQRMIGFC